MNPGEVIDGRFRLLHSLGEGAAASVFQGLDLELDRPVALKFLTGDGTIADPARFEEEARALAQLQHPNVLQVYGSGVHRGRPFLALELADGGSLLGLAFEGEIAPGEQLRLATGVADALAAAHAAGILHRDVKPENVLLTKDGTPKLSDFGLAKLSVSQVRTRTGWILGTPEYMAPEILAGQPATAATDVYAWGCLAYLLANRSPPVTGELREIARAARKGVYRPGKEVGALAAAIQAALDPDPTRRPDARGLVQLLRAPVAQPPTRVNSVMRGSLPARPAAPAAAPAASGRWARAAAAGALILTLGLLLGRPWARGPSPAPGSAGAAPPASRGPVLDDLVTRWRVHALGLGVEDRIRYMHAKVFPNSEAAGYIEEMGRHRSRTPGGPDLDLTWLREAAAQLPLREALDQDRATLRQVLTDPARLGVEKAELLRALAPLRYLDQYHEALGEPPPYDLRPLVRAAFPYRFDEGTPAKERPEDEPPGDPPADPDVPLGPGKHLLRRWTTETDVAFPWLVAQGGEPHARELQWLLFAKMSTSNRWEKAGHEFLRGRFRLEGDPQRRFTQARISVEVGNLFLPQLLRVEVNDLELDILRDPARVPRSKWRHRAVGEEVLVLPVPTDVLREGLNGVRITVRPLPGLLRYQGIEADRVWVELVAGD